MTHNLNVFNVEYSLYYRMSAAGTGRADGNRYMRTHFFFRMGRADIFTMGQDQKLDLIWDFFYFCYKCSDSIITDFIPRGQS